MAATSSSYAHQQPRFQPHIPKLLYRTASSDTTSTHGSVSTVPTDVSSLSASTAPTSPRHSDYCPSPKSARLPPDALVANGPNSPSPLPPKTTPPKKRGGSFLRMFSVKEPSTQAFEDYQKQMLKKGASKNGRVAPVGMPGVSSAKLPPTVPKVNSKWDGVPHAIKEREKEKETALQQSLSGYSRSITSSRSNGTQSTSSSTSHEALDNRRNGKLSYNQRSGNLSDIYGWEIQGSSSGSVAKDFAFENKTPSHAPKPEFTAVFPRHISQPPNTPTDVQKQASTNLTLPPERYASPTLIPNYMSPPTPSPHPSPRIVVASPQSDQDFKDDIKTTTLEIHPHTEEVKLTSTGVNILGPPASARRKPKPQPFPAGEAEEMKLPRGNVPIRPILKKDSKPRTADMPPHALLSATAPKYETDTAQRPNTAREWLDLGVGIKNPAVTSWDPSKDGTQENGRDSTPTPQGGQRLRRMSRMSLFSK